MKSQKSLVVIIVCIIIAISGIIGGMFITGKFNGLMDKYHSQPEVQTEAETEEEIPRIITRSKTDVPPSPSALFVDVSDDITEDNIAEFGENGFNTLIFPLTADNSRKTSEIISLCNKAEIYCGVYCDCSSDNAVITEFLSGSNPDFLILHNIGEENEGYEARLKDILLRINAIDSSLTIGMEPCDCSETDSVLLPYITDSNNGFIFLMEKKDPDSAFALNFAKWSDAGCSVWICHNVENIASYTSAQAADKISQISKSFSIESCKAVCLTPYSSVASLEAEAEAGQSVLEYIRTKESLLENKDFSVSNHSSSNITVDESSISFTGTSSPLYSLTCDGKEVERADNGDFSVECKLNKGTNTITFEHKGTKHIYTVIYKIKLLKSVSPENTVTVPGGMMVEITAVAHKDASVSVKFNGKNYTMSISETKSDDGENKDISEDGDFATFTASVTTPASTSSVQNLGKYTVSASYSGLNESLRGATVKVSAKPKVPDPVPETAPPTTRVHTTVPAATTVPDSPADVISTISRTEFKTGEIETVTSPQTSVSTTKASSEPIPNQKYSYTSNYGLGTATICSITADYVETFPGNTTSTYSVPDCTPLLKGTTDYVTGTADFGGETYYILSSGLKVPVSHTEGGKQFTHLSISEGYIMPSNSLQVKSCSTANGTTTIKIETNRRVPFQSKLLGQTYYAYTAGRNVSVKSVNCTGLQFTFYDTVSASGSLSSMNSLIKNASFSTSGKETTLTFKFSSAGKFYGYHYEYDDSGLLVIRIKSKPSSLAGYTIMLDPGHGGSDPGAICVVSSEEYGYEKQIDLSIALKIKELLEAEGATVLMTRTGDSYSYLSSRLNMCRQRHPDMFISIHCDASENSSTYGTTAYYYRAYSQPLASAIHAAVVDAYKTDIYKENDSGISNGTSFYAYLVNRVEECPSVLIEYGFVTNTNECIALQDSASREILAKATVTGIKNYISNN